MAGPDKADGSLEHTRHAAHILGVERALFLKGPINKSDVPAFLNEGDIFLNTSNVDNTPVSVLEAMACGLCVVSTDVGGIRYLLGNGEDALLVPPEEPVSMAEAVRKILKGSETAAMLSRNARRKAESFAWKAILPEWNRVLERVVRRHPDPASHA
jgi:glycosyltransferase involved in cell wall biosynthesis